jgi:hypothetical protein
MIEKTYPIRYFIETFFTKIGEAISRIGWVATKGIPDEYFEEKFFKKFGHYENDWMQSHWEDDEC